MCSRVILARLNGTASDTSVLNGALSLASVANGHIQALFTQSDPRTNVMALSEEGTFPGAYQAILEIVEKEAARTSAQARNQFDKWRAAHHLEARDAPNGEAGPSVEWRQETGQYAAMIAAVGRLSDVIVMARPTDRLDDRFDLGFEAALLETGRPIFLVPPKSQADTPLKNILIAWNGSVEAARAVAASMPLLAGADRVTVFTAAQASVEQSAAQGLVDYLRWNKVPASVFQNGRHKANSVEESVLSAAKTVKADVLVMGAYTHSRMRELIFGGVTRHVLSHAKLPVLMAH